MADNAYSTLSPEKQAQIAFRFMGLYKSNPKGFGYGKGIGVRFDSVTNKCEYEKGSIGWQRGQVKTEDWIDHLAGVKALGLGPNLDNGTCFWGSIDVDKVGSDKYTFNVNEIVKLSAQLRLPLVPDFSKSGGLHLKVFFSEPVESILVVRYLKLCASRLGCSGNEIFPKQTGELAGADDFPSWMFMPYGPQYANFVEQCGINPNGGLMEIEEYLDVCEKNRLSRVKFVKIVEEMEDASVGHTQDRASNRNKGSGLWAEGTSMLDTVKETFKSGPPCLHSIAMIGCSVNRNIFLFNVCIFLRKKYPDNWKEVLQWVNLHINRPPLAMEEIEGIIKSQWKDYNYQCGTSPLCDFCYSSACRQVAFGVGSGGKDESWTEWGMSIILSDPRVFIVNMTNKRVSVKADDLMNQRLYRKRWVEATGTMPPDKMKGADWEMLVKKNFDLSVEVEPPSFLTPEAYDIEILTQYLWLHIPHNIRVNGKEYLEGKIGDEVRIRIVDKRIYFKTTKLKLYLESRGMSRNEIVEFRQFLRDKVLEHDRTYHLGGFFRSSCSVDFDLIPEMQEWLGFADDVKEANKEG
jgi:hypothetical protein